MKSHPDYPTGQRVRLVSTNDPWTSLAPGDEGTVMWMDDAATVKVCWDRGGHLGVVLAHEIRERSGASLWEMFDDPPDAVPDVVEKIEGEARWCDRCQAIAEDRLPEPWARWMAQRRSS